MSKTTNKFSPEVRERAVRLVFDNVGQHGSRWQTIMSIAAKCWFWFISAVVRVHRPHPFAFNFRSRSRGGQ